jgi:hypothetical protein
MEAGSESLTVWLALGLSREMVTLREPTLRGDRGDRGGETESSDMLVGCVGACSPGLGDCFTGVAFWAARSPNLLGGWELGPRASRWGLCGSENGVDGAQPGLHKWWMRRAAAV